MKPTTRIALSVFPEYVWVAIRKELFIRKCNRQIRSSANRQKIKAVNNREHIRLQLGCGKRIFDNWVNVDIYQEKGIDLQLNFREALPFDDGKAALIYSEHVWEHLFKPEAIRLLRESYRVLEKGGRIRLGVPDAELYFKKYLAGDKAWFAEHKHLGGAVEPLATPVDVINQVFRMGGDHLFAWDYETLKIAMEDAGFKDVKRYDAGQASVQDLCLDDPKHAFETLYVEGIK